MGSRIGEWVFQLLASPSYELVDRVAALGDSDDRESDAPTPPSWLGGFDSQVVAFFQNHPTLEPAVTTGNETLVSNALARSGLSVEGGVSADSIDRLFRGTGRGRKGEFAYALAEEFDAALDSGSWPIVPPHIEALFVHLQPGRAVSADGAGDEEINGATDTSD
jgi:putative ATP-dependent endonuclease of OLD family